MSEIEDLEKHLADLVLQREEEHLTDLKRQRGELESSGKQIECPECNITRGKEITKQETSTERAKRIALRFGIDIEGWKLDESCGPYWSMMANPKTNTILLCSAYMKGETDESIAYDLAHEVSHKKTRDEALATLYAIEMLKDKISSDVLKGMARAWFDDYSSRTSGEKFLYPADLEYLEKVRKYITGEEETDEECPECRTAAGVGMYLSICKELDSEENCEDLFKKVDSGEITPDEFFGIIKEKAEDDPEKLDILEYTDDLMDSEDVETKGNPTVNPNPRRPLRSNRRAFTKDGIPVVEHTWLYGDTIRGYSIKRGGSKPKYTPESYIWDDGFVVDRSDYENERDARLYAYRDMKRWGWNLEPASEEQADIEEEDTEVKVKPKKPVKPKVEPVVKPKPSIKIEDELSALKKQEMKYYREEVAAKDYASKIEAYRKRLEVSKKIRRLTRPPIREKPVLTRRQMQLEHEAKQIARIQKLDGRIETQARMDAELQVVKKEYDPEEVDDKDPVLFERRVEKHRTKLKDDISSLKQDKNVSIADNEIKYDGEYMTYSHKLTEEEFKAIK